MRPAHPDWFHVALVVSGPSEDLWNLRMRAAGAGVIPWAIDYQAEEERVFTLMMTTTDPKTRTVSAAGCRIIAKRMVEDFWQEHEEAVARVGMDKSCQFDPFALVPVPWSVLRLGPDHPDAEAWLWEHWGIVWPLRRIDAGPPSPARKPKRLPAGHAAWQVTFWTADWVPWQLIARCRERWPTLRIAVNYDLSGDAFPKRVPAAVPIVDDECAPPIRRRPSREDQLRWARQARERADAAEGLSEARA